MYKNALIYILKYPEPGKVKTRLAKDFGIDLTVKLYECFIRDTLKTLKKIPFHVRLFIAPPEQQDAMRLMLTANDCDFPIHPQQGKDLGERMQAAFQKLFSLGYQSATIIGSDFPDLPASLLTDAIAAFDNADAVIGPNFDGGYYLLGFKQNSFCQKVFVDMPWSTDSVFNETLKRLNCDGLRVKTLPSFWDVDDIDDLRDFMERNLTGDFSNSETMRFLKDASGGSPRAKGRLPLEPRL
ncbi:MAG: glycosyltransferase [bacterium]|nr:glycosyltransferase [bacterium]